MMATIRRLLGIRPSVAVPPPVTFKDVAPAPRDPEMERQIRAAQIDLVQDKMRLERRSWEIRQELAGNVLNIVSGDAR